MGDLARPAVVLLVCSLLQFGCGPKAEAPQPEAQVEMIQVVRLTNGNVFYPNSISENGDTVTLELSDLGRVDFKRSEIESIKEVPASSAVSPDENSEESRMGMVLVDGQWTTPGGAKPQPTTQNYAPRVYYFEQTEAGLLEAQRELERATKAHASADEIISLKETIRDIRASVADQAAEKKRVQDLAQERVDAIRQKKQEREWDYLGLNAVERAQAEMEAKPDPDKYYGSYSDKSDEDYENVKIINYNKDGTVTVETSY